MTSQRIFEPKIRSLIDTPLSVGESPVWDERTGAIWFVDILAPAAYRLRANGSLDRFDMPAAIGCLGLCENGMVLAGLQTGVHLLDPATGQLEFFCDPDGGSRTVASMTVKSGRTVISGWERETRPFLKPGMRDSIAFHPTAASPA